MVATVTLFSMWPAQQASKGVGDKEKGKKGGGLVLFSLPLPLPLPLPFPILRLPRMLFSVR